MPGEKTNASFVPLVAITRAGRNPPDFSSNWSPSSRSPRAITPAHVNTRLLELTPDCQSRSYRLGTRAVFVGSNETFDTLRTAPAPGCRTFFAATGKRPHFLHNARVHFHNSRWKNILKYCYIFFIDTLYIIYIV